MLTIHHYTIFTEAICSNGMGKRVGPGRVIVIDAYAALWSKPINKFPLEIVVGVLSWWIPSAQPTNICGCRTHRSNYSPTITKHRPNTIFMEIPRHSVEDQDEG